MAQQKKLFDIGADDDLRVAMMNLHMAMQCATEDNSQIIQLLRDVQQHLKQYSVASDADIKRGCEKFSKRCY